MQTPSKHMFIQLSKEMTMIYKGGNTNKRFMSLLLVLLSELCLVLRLYIMRLSDLLHLETSGSCVILVEVL